MYGTDWHCVCSNSKYTHLETKLHIEIYAHFNNQQKLCSFQRYGGLRVENRQIVPKPLSISDLVWGPFFEFRDQPDIFCTVAEVIVFVLIQYQRVKNRPSGQMDKKTSFAVTIQRLHCSLYACKKSGKSAVKPDLCILS